MSPLNLSRSYSIQNVDFSSCLEMTVRPVNKLLSARLWKDSDKQRWKFVIVPGREDEYYIYNVAQKTYVGLLSESDRRLSSKSRLNASKWLLYPVKSSRGIQTFEIVLSGEETDTCLQLGEFGNAHIAERDDSEAQQWRISSGPPPPPFLTHAVTLAAGYYRIRNLDGESILSLPAEDGIADGSAEYPSAYITEQDSDNDNQRWFVKPKPEDDRRFTIQSSTNRGDFLGVDNTQLVQLGAVRGLPYEFSWELQSVGGFGYSMHVKSVQGSLSLGFVPQTQSDISGRAILLPSNNNHSQVWLFERWDKIPEGITSTNDLAGRWRSVGASSFPDRNGWYNICSLTHSAYYLHLNGAYGAPHTHPIHPSYIKAYGSFYLVRKGRQFQIKDRSGTPLYAMVTAGSNVLQRTEKETEASWWYLKYEKSKEAYYICLHEPTKKKGDPIRILGNAGGNVSGSFYYNLPITPISVGNTAHIWSIQ